jgi:hypothetical protein
MSSKAVFAGALLSAMVLPARAAMAEDAPPPHRGPWPVRNGHNVQPTEQDLKASQIEDVTPDQAREIDRLYDQLLSGSETIRPRRPAPKH